MEKPERECRRVDSPQRKLHAKWVKLERVPKMKEGEKTVT
jgi:hypothetical protein